MHRSRERPPAKGPSTGPTAVAILASLLWAGTGEACVGPGPGPPDAELVRCPFVFVGRVVAIRDTAITDTARMLSRMRVWRERIATVRVERSWKGVPRDTLVEVHTPQQSGMCGFPFERGRRYLIYASLDKCGAIATSSLTRTTSRRSAAADFRALGRATMPRARSGWSTRHAAERIRAAR
jgi:hypothetical protein